jgi:DNA-binding response OmpR family regulator
MTEQRSTVLVVERSSDTRELVGRWLEEAGYDVMACPGPTGPDYRCLAGRGRSCPLTNGADAVVVDLWLESDMMMEGTSGVDLLGDYLSSGLPVLALTHGSEPVHLFCEEELATLAGPLDRREIVETVRALLGQNRTDGGSMMGAMTTSPWPGPGDSEGPVDPEGWTAQASDPSFADSDRDEPDDQSFTTAPWPGPGDSEG